MAKLILEADSRQIRTATGDLRNLNQTGSKSDNIVGSLGRTFALIGGAAFIGKAIQGTADFTQAIADLSAITGATGDDLQYYREQAAEIGRTTSLSASQAATAFKLIASAKPDLLESATALNAVTQEAITLAEATGMDLPAAAQALGSALNQFQIDSSRANEVINILAASSKLGTAEVSAVTEAMRNAGSAANSLGVDFAETVAGIQALAAAGRQGADAGTALRQVLLRLESTGDKNLMPSVVGLNGALQELKTRTLDNTQLMDLFGQEAFTAATSLLAQSETVGRLNQTLRGTNTATEQAAIRMNTLTGDLKSLGSAIEGLQIAVFGSEVEGLNREIVQLATDGVNFLTENIDVLATASTALALVFGARMVGSLSSTTAAFIASQIQAVRYQATLASMAGVSRGAAISISAVGAAASTAARGMALLGGPIGVVALAASALFMFADDAGERAEQRAQTLKVELDRLTASFGMLTAAAAKQKELELTAQLGELMDEAAPIRKQIEDIEKSIQGIGVSASSVTIAKNKIAELREELKDNAGQAAVLEKAIAELAEIQLEAAEASRSKAAADKMMNEAQDAEKFREVADAIGLQVLELSAGAEAAERYQLIQRVGRDLTEDEIRTLDSLLERRRELTEQLQRESEQKSLRTASMQIGFELEVGDDPALQAEDRMYERLSVIDNALAAEAISKEEHRQLEKALEKEYQSELSRITEEGIKQRQQAEEQARQVQKQQWDDALGATAQVFGNLAEIAKQGGKDSFENYKILASAQAGVSGVMAFMNALATPAPFPIPQILAGTIAGITTAQIAKLNSQQYSPRAQGGQVIGGEKYLIGERGPEVWEAPGMGRITPYNELMREARSNSQPDQAINQAPLNVNFEILANDAQGFDELLVSRRDLIYNMITQALADQGRTF